MARIRSIHPEFFVDEDVFDLEPLTRLLFLGLLTVADDQGVVQRRAKTLKHRLLPADDVDIEAAVAELEDAGFVVAYEADNKPYLAIRNFCRFQKVKYPSAKHPLPRELTQFVQLPMEPVPQRSGKKKPYWMGPRDSSSVVLPHGFPNPPPTLPPGEEWSGVESRGEECRPAAASIDARRADDMNTESSRVQRPDDVEPDRWQGWLERGMDFITGECPRIAKQPVDVRRNAVARAALMGLPTLPASRDPAVRQWAELQRAQADPMPGVLEWLADLERRVEEGRKGRAYVRKALDGGPEGCGAAEVRDAT